MTKLFIALLLLPSLSRAQVNHFKAYQITLQYAQKGRVHSFDKSRKDDHDSLVVVYLGRIVTQKGRVLKFLTSRWYWGLAPRGTSRIVIFNEKNQYLGDYYLTMTYEVPHKIEGKNLVFISDENSDNCPPGFVTRISFRNGIPRQFFSRCAGDIYVFSQNLFR